MRRFNLCHLTKVSAQTFTRGCKKRIQLGKTLHRFLDFNRKYFTLILKMTMTIKWQSTALINSVWVVGTENLKT